METKRLAMIIFIVLMRPIKFFNRIGRYYQNSRSKISQMQICLFKNKFPVEVFLNYSGDKNLSADFTIAQGNSILAKQSIAFSSSKNGSLKCTSPANKIGSIIFKASISSAEKKKHLQ
jgi:hypothetical protein